MMKNMKKLSLAVIAISTAMLSTSCLREENSNVLDDKFVSFKVNTDNVSVTKAASLIEPIELVDLSENGLDLFLLGSVEINELSPIAPRTKATAPQYTGGDVDIFNIRMDGVVGTAQEGSGDFWYMYDLDHQKVLWGDESNDASFLAYYSSVKNAKFTDNINEISYSSKTGTDDLYVAFTKHSHVHKTYPSSDDNYVALTFKHPLALVKFKVVSTDAKPIEVSQVVVNNAATEGTIKASVDEDNNAVFEYSYSEIDNISVDKDEDGVYSIYVMPDVISDKDINVTFYVNGKVLTTAKLGVGSWEAGKIYNYTIASDTGAVGIDIMDAGSATVSNVMPNTVYLRAAVVVNEMQNGRVVKTLNPDILNLKDTDWQYAEKDGFYYYKTPVIGYMNAEALLKSFNSGLYQVSVAVQAVEYDSDRSAAKEAWGEDVLSYLDTL